MEARPARIFSGGVGCGWGWGGERRKGPSLKTIKKSGGREKNPGGGAWKELGHGKGGRKVEILEQLESSSLFFPFLSRHHNSSLVFWNEIAPSPAPANALSAPPFRAFQFRRSTMATLMAARGGVATSSAASTRTATPSFSSSFRVSSSSSSRTTAANRSRSPFAAAASLTTQEQLPASHASQAALEQLRAASAGGVNREFGERV